MSAKTSTEYSYSIVRSRIEPGEADETAAMQAFAQQAQDVFDQRVAKGWRLVHASDVLFSPADKARLGRHGFVQQHFVFSRDVVEGTRAPTGPGETVLSFTLRAVSAVAGKLLSDPDAPSQLPSGAEDDDEDSD